MNLNKNPGIDLVADERIWSESVYADCVSSDGHTAIMTRLCRYPEYSTSWLWAFCFLTQGIYGYNNNYLPCDNEISLVEGPDLNYIHLRQEKAKFERFGPRDSPNGAQVTVDIKAHKGSKVPQNLGPLKMQIKADITPKHKPWRLNRYRTEWINDAKIVVKIDDLEFKYKGSGHWHEQHQKAPRWKIQFTYISLRGDNLCLIGSATEPNDAGFVVNSSKRTKITQIKIDPPSTIRNIKITLEDNSTLNGTIHTIYNYLVPIYNQLRPGTIVTAQFKKELLSGVVNDWLIND
ncbi:MAG: hypothetical protein ACFE94_07050 [Candidatus Hodarchaeota archaeon]